jgi:TM2 domain-containing membrane protein YozV
LPYLSDIPHDISGTAKGTIIESPTDFTNANFQEWVRVLEETKKTAFLVYDENGNTLAEGKIDMEEGIINEIVHVVDQANIALISIPKEQRNFHSTSQAFFKDHPQPFVDVAAKTVVQQQPPQPKSSQPGSTSMPVSSSKKSPILAAVLSFFLFGGIGQVYLGQWKKGFTLIVANFLMNSFLMLFMPISIPIVSVLGVGDAYGTAQEMEKGSSSGEWKFNINWKAAGAALLIYGLREIIFLVIRKSSG